MKTLIFAGFSAWCASFAGAQPIHHGFIWLEGPEGVLAANTTYTMEAWGRWESPLFVDGTSAMAGFYLDVVNVAGSGTNVASVGNVQIAEWATRFGLIEGIDGTNLIGVSGGQLADLFILPPLADRRNPIPLFTFQFTTAGGPVGGFTFAPVVAESHALSFYPDSFDGYEIVAPNDPESSLTLTEWEYVVPSPGAILGLGTLLVCARRRR